MMGREGQKVRAVYDSGGAENILITRPLTSISSFENTMLTKDSFTVLQIVQLSLIFLLFYFGLKQRAVEVNLVKSEEQDPEDPE